MSTPIGVFEFTCLAALLGLVPGRTWEGPLWARAAARLDGLWRMPVAMPRAAQRGPLPNTPPLPARLLTALLLLLVVASNVESLTGRRSALPYPLAGPAFALNLQQRWEIFTGIDQIKQGWFFVLGETLEGAQVNVLTGEPARRIERPADPAAMFPNHNDRRYWTQLALERNRALRPMLADHLCRTWRMQHGTGLRRVAIFRVGERAGEVADAPRMLVKHSCR